MSKGLSYADAVKLLGGADSRVVAALDKLVGGLLLGATGGGGQFVLNLFDAKGELARLSEELVHGLGTRLRGLGRFDRTERLAAAHKVIVLTAYFETLAKVGWPFKGRGLRLSKSVQLRLATGEEASSNRLRTLTDILYDKNLPGEAGLRGFYAELSERLIGYLREVPEWERLDPEAQETFAHSLRGDALDQATGRYEELLRRLAAEFPEVAFWSNRLDHAGIAEQLQSLGISLTGLGETLERIASGRAPDDRRQALTRRYRRRLERPILAADDVPAGLTIPTLAQAYINPEFRAAQVTRSSRFEEEYWWVSHPIREDLQGFLIGHLTSIQATAAPLIVLGQPGSGKSVLTEVVAASLPANDFLAIRVALRDVPADADLQSQIESAIRSETGERLAWPALARAAGDAMPVIMLDGFDELLQATGIGQTDYLEQVARFQEREADQGRPLAVIVTSRTAVADRARIPSAGAVVVKLEPFNDDQVRRWLTIWNAANAAYLTTPLTADVVLRQPALAGQPLLLTMLAIYDAEEGALQRFEEGLDEAELYERLLTTFVEREVHKIRPGLAADPLRRAVEEELLRLSVAAFAMFNRGRHWVTENELSADLTALIGADVSPRPHIGFHEPSTPAQTVIGRFFFIHQARAIRNNTRLTTIEFLHATFSEYLIARLIARDLADLAAVTAVTTIRSRRPSDHGFLRALLSFVPLTARAQIVVFLTALTRGPSHDGAEQLRRLLLIAFHDALEPARDPRHEDYAPEQITGPARHAAYSANLLLLIILIGGPVSGRDLFPQAPFPVVPWRQHALLWRSQFSGGSWRSLTATLQLRRIWDNDERDIVISTEQVSSWRLDGFWINKIAPTDPMRKGWGWRRVDVHDLRRESHFTCDLAEDIIWHGLEPLIQELETRTSEIDAEVVEATTAFGVLSGEVAMSVTHALIKLWLASSRPAGTDELEQAYDNCLTVIERSRPEEDVESRDAYYARVLRQLAADRTRLSGEFRIKTLDRLRSSILERDYLDHNPQVRSWAAEAFADLGWTDT